MTITSAGPVTLVVVLTMGSLEMTTVAMLVGCRIVDPPADADALPTQVGLPALIATSIPSLRVFSVQLAGMQVVWPSNSLCWAQPFASSAI